MRHASWRLAGPFEIEVDLPAPQADGGSLFLLISGFAESFRTVIDEGGAEWRTVVGLNGTMDCVHEPDKDPAQS
jgi:hypothetical protein